MISFPDDKRIKRSGIEKLYFNEFSYRVHVIHTNDVTISEHLAAAMKSEGNWNYRSQWAATSFYFVHREDAAAFANAAGPCVCEINEPCDSFPFETLQANPNLVFRKELWFRKYRHKVLFKLKTPHFHAELGTFLSEFLDVDINGDVPVSDRAYASVGTTCVVYVADDEDLVLFRLRFDKEISSISSVLLHDEINCQAAA
jgi:hypothetical protein